MPLTPRLQDLNQKTGFVPKRGIVVLSLAESITNKHTRVGAQCRGYENKGLTICPSIALGVSPNEAPVAQTLCSFKAPGTPGEVRQQFFINDMTQVSSTKGGSVDQISVVSACARCERERPLSLSLSSKHFRQSSHCSTDN